MCALPGRIYRNGEIFCWLSNTGHWPDTGGAVPGGFSASATAVEQEGLRLPPVKLFKKGEMDQEIYAIICSNIRVADQRIGDVKAQAAALLVGEERLTELLDRYGDDTVREAIAELRRRAAQQMRAHIVEDPRWRLHVPGHRRQRRRGRRTARNQPDGDQGGGRTGLRLFPILAALPGADEFGAGDDPVARSTSPCATSFPNVPISAGAFEPLKVRSPEGTFLDAHYPRPVSGCAAEVSQRIAEAVFAALVDAPAGPGDGRAGRHQRQFCAWRSRSGKGRDFVMYQLSGGGYGGNSGS